MQVRVSIAEAAAHDDADSWGDTSAEQWRRLLTFPEARPAAKSVGKELATRPAASSSAVTAGSWPLSPAQQQPRFTICGYLLRLAPTAAGTTYPCHPRHLLHLPHRRCCHCRSRCRPHHHQPAGGLRKRSCWLCTSGLQCESVNILRHLCRSLWHSGDAPISLAGTPKVCLRSRDAGVVIGVMLPARATGAGNGGSGRGPAKQLMPPAAALHCLSILGNPGWRLNRVSQIADLPAIEQYAGELAH
jgi:hypothetical protein